jgi:tRNA(Arg) A34 adenosine deaminase TadA
MATSCRAGGAERAVTTPHLALVRRCYALADEAVARGDQPFGALLAQGGIVVAESRNAVVTSRDSTRHAELALLADALPAIAPSERARLVLYASTEPCMMCAAAIYWAGIATVVFGCSAAALADAAGSDFLVPCREVFARGRRSIAVVGPVAEDEGHAQHRAFWSRVSPADR